MRHKLIRAGVSAKAPKEVIDEFLREYCFDDLEKLPEVPEGAPWFYSVTYDALEVQTLDQYIQMVGQYLPDGKVPGIVFKSKPWRYEITKEMED